MADRYTKIRAKQLKDHDLRPEEIDAENTPNIGDVPSYNGSKWKWISLTNSSDIWFVYNEDETEEYASSFIEIEKLNLSVTIPSTGKYKLYFVIEAFTRRLWGAGRGIVRFLMNGEEINLSYVEQSDYEVITCLKQLDFNENGNINFSIKYKISAWGTTIYVRRARILLERLKNE